MSTSHVPTASANAETGNPATSNQPGGAALPSFRDEGSGSPVLLLHGGGGPATVAGLSKALAENFRVLTPTHPGFDGTARPGHLDSAAALADQYLEGIRSLGLSQVLLIGSSIGGWVAAEMALRGGGLIKGAVLLNPVGILVPGESVANPFKLSPLELVKLAFHNPEPILSRASPPTPEQREIQASNAAALAAYDAGALMMQPGLRERLAAVVAPTLVLWGESDRIASKGYGQAFAAAFPHGRFVAIAQAGHLPHVEQLGQVTWAIGEFADGLV